MEKTQFAIIAFIVAIAASIFTFISYIIYEKKAQKKIIEKQKKEASENIRYFKRAKNIHDLI